eukprot:2526088-Amphidinium_carterae.1
MGLKLVKRTSLCVYGSFEQPFQSRVSAAGPATLHLPAKPACSANFQHLSMCWLRTTVECFKN